MLHSIISFYIWHLQSNMDMAWMLFLEAFRCTPFRVLYQEPQHRPPMVSFKVML
jgi:hypothetical protein